MATSTVEDYLKRILLEQQDNEGRNVATGVLADALEVTPGTVTSMMKAMAESGLVSWEPYAGVALTRQGRHLAVHVLRRHRLIELFLVQIMGMDWSEVHDEAERLEHAVSERLVERMDEMLGYPEVDPHGDPIPTAQGDVARASSLDLVAAPVGEWLVVSRVLDQSPEFLRFLERSGLVPGTRVRIQARAEAADLIELEQPDGQRLGLGLRAAERVMVEVGSVVATTSGVA